MILTLLELSMAVQMRISTREVAIASRPRNLLGCRRHIITWPATFVGELGLSRLPSSMPVFEAILMAWSSLQ